MTDTTSSPITNRTAIKLPLSVFIGLLTAVAGAAFAFRQTISSTVASQLVPYVPRLEWEQRMDAEREERRQDFWAIRNELTRIETILRITKGVHK